MRQEAAFVNSASGNVLAGDRFFQHRFVCASRRISSRQLPSHALSRGSPLHCIFALSDKFPADVGTESSSLPTYSLPTPPPSSSEPKVTTGRLPRVWTQNPGTVWLGSVSPGQILVGSVAQITAEQSSVWLDVNVVRLARGGRIRYVRARLPFDRQRGPRAENFGPAPRLPPREAIGRKISVRVKRADTASGRLEVERVVPVKQRLVGAQSAKRKKGSLRRKRDKPPARIIENGRYLETLEVGEQLNGEVVKSGTYGVLIDCEIARVGTGGRVQATYGLLQRKRFPATWASEADMVIRDDTTRQLHVGDAITVYVRAAHVANGFLWLSATPVDLDALAVEKALWKTKIRRIRRRKLGPESLVVGEERVGIVRHIAKYGAFVDVGVKTDGMVHYSAMGKELGRDWKDKLIVGSEVVVTVESVKDERVALAFVRFKSDSDAAFEISEDLQGPMARPAAPASAECVQSTTSATAQPSSVSLARSVLSSSSAEELDPEDTLEDDVKVVNDDDNGGDGYDDKFSDSYFEDKYDY
jgi:S1 RNA binding domain